MKKQVMAPILIAVFNLDGKASGLLHRVEQRLRRRGLQVQALNRLEDPIASDSDVVLVPCSPRQAQPLAAEIERLWSKRWTRWYEKEARRV